jgi:hypothetical protein
MANIANIPPARAIDCLTRVEPRGRLRAGAENVGNFGDSGDDFMVSTLITCLIATILPFGARALTARSILAIVTVNSPAVTGEF